MNFKNLKLVVLLWMIVFCGKVSFGQETKTVVFTPSEVKGSVSGGSINKALPDEMTNGEITIACTDAAFATDNDEYRFLSGSSTTFSTINGKITKIVFINLRKI